MNFINLNVQGSIKFERQDPSQNPRSIIEITNPSPTNNVSFKFRTTAPKLFVVKPVHGIVQPNRTV